MTKRNPRNRPGPSSQDHRKLFEDAHDAILIFSLEDETVLDVNARACEIYGFSRREFIGKSIKAISKDPKRGESHLKKTLLARTKHSFESTQFRKDGSEMCLAISASVIDHHGGKVILSINRDITQQKQAQDALEESERRYRSVVDVLAEGIVLQNASGEIEACNASAEAILGLTKSQMMGRSSLDPRWRAIRADGSPFPGDEHPAMKALKSRKPVTGEIMGVYKPDGTLTWISINSQPMFQRQGEKPYAAVTSFHDITDQMETRRQLYQNEKRYRSLYRNTPAMLHSCGPDGRIVEVSDTWLSTLGYARSEVLGKAPGAFYTDASKAFIEQVARPALVKAGRVDDIAVTAKKRNGDLVEALLSSVVEYDDRGDVVRTHSVMVDVTEKHDALNRLKEQSEFLRQVVDTNPNLIFVIVV